MEATTTPYDTQLWDLVMQWWDHSLDPQSPWLWVPSYGTKMLIHILTKLFILWVWTTEKESTPPMRHWGHPLQTLKHTHYLLIGSSARLQIGTRLITHPWSYTKTSANGISRPLWNVIDTMLYTAQVDINLTQPLPHKLDHWWVTSETKWIEVFQRNRLSLTNTKISLMMPFW